MSRAAAARAAAGALLLVAALGGTARAEYRPFASPIVEPPVERVELPNGLVAFLQPDPRSSRVAVAVSYGVGRRDQPPSLRGLAHLTEHLMFQGSRHVGDDRLYAILERAGATEVNATTGPDRTTYWEVVPSSELEVALWLESDRMAYLLDRLSEETVDQQRAVVLREHHEHRGGSPLSRLGQVVLTRLFPDGHPYAAVDETPEDLAAIRLEQVQWFFQRYYAPHNARLALVGGFDPAEARRLLERYFATIRPSLPPPAPRARRADPVPLAGERRITFAAAHPRTRLYLVWPTPAFLQPGDAELDYAMRLLGDGPLSRLHGRLVSGLGLATSVSAGQDSRELGSIFTIEVVLESGASPAEVLAVVDEELERLASEPPSEAEMRRVGLGMEARLLRIADGIGDRAWVLASWLSPRGGDEPYGAQDDAARYAAVTARSVSAAVRRWLPRDRRLRVEATPSATVGMRGAVVMDEIVPARGAR